MKAAARKIHERGAKNVFVKGGSKLAGQGSAVDVFFDGQEFNQVEGAMIDTRWTHGAGCTTAAAITAGLALGLEPYEAVSRAKKFITLSLRGSFALNRWVGPGNPSLWRKGFN
jgi:pyridoxine kinase